MSEKQMWAYLQPKLAAGGLHCERLTDRVQEGLPDVLCVREVDSTTALFEMKFLPALPKNLFATPVLTYGSHGLQTAQAFWLNRWARRGGTCGVLLRVGQDDWYYWRAEPQPNWIEFIMSVEAIKNVDWHWAAMRGRVDINLLIEALCE